MKIGILGYGKMGKLIEQVSLARKHAVALIVDQHNRGNLTCEDLDKCDVAIEFSTPATALPNIKFCLECGTRVVVGTTGEWYAHLEELRALACSKHAALLYASNFSLGVNIAFKVNSFLSKIMAKYPEYIPSIEEIHHTEKKDAPSGTAISLAAQILDNDPARTSWRNIMVGASAPGTSCCSVQESDELLITSKRSANEPGTHIVRYTSEVDVLSLGHRAFNRMGFAEGAVVAAEWLQGKEGVFTMEDVLAV